MKNIAVALSMMSGRRAMAIVPRRFFSPLSASLRTGEFCPVFSFRSGVMAPPRTTMG